MAVPDRLGPLLARLRREQGLSQARLAELLAEASGNPAISRHEVSRWENERGGRMPSTYWLRHLAEAFGSELRALERAAAASRAARAVDLPDGYDLSRLDRGHWARSDTAELGQALACAPVSAETASRLAHEWLLAEPAQLVELRSGRRLGTATADRISARVHRLRLLDDHVGGPDLVGPVTRELEATVGLVRAGAYTEAVGRRLLGAVAELCQLAGWVASDAGRYDAASRYYLAGVRAAQAAGDRAVAANLLSCLAYQTANVGDPRDAVLLARTAVAGAERSTTPLVRALLTERLAWAYARTADLAGTERALGLVDDAYAAADLDREPDWVYWLDRDEIDVMAGRCYTELHRPLRAVPLLRQAVGRYDRTRARETALYLTWLAVAYLGAGEVEQAATTAADALRSARAVSSRRAADRIGLLRRRLGPYHRLPAVRELTAAFG